MGVTDTSVFIISWRWIGWVSAEYKGHLIPRTTENTKLSRLLPSIVKQKL